MYCCALGYVYMAIQTYLLFKFLNVLTVISELRKLSITFTGQYRTRPTMSRVRKTQELRAENIFSDKNDPIELKMLLFVLRHKKIAFYTQLVSLVLNIGAFVYCVRGKLAMYSNIDVKGLNCDVITLINFLSDFLLLVVHIFGMKGFTRFSFFVEVFTFILKKRGDPVKQKSGILTKYVQILRFIPLIPTIAGTYIFSRQVGWHIEQYFVPREIWYYILNVTVCSYICFTYKIKERFNDMNDNLEQLIKNDALSFTIIAADVPIKVQLNADRPLKTRTKLESLMELTSNYTTLCNLLDKYNRYTKGHMSLVMLNIMINILFNVTTIVAFTLRSNVYAVGLRTTVFVVQTMLAVASMGQAAGIAYVGESLEEEGERTSRICYTYLNKLNRNTKTDYDKKLIKEVKFLLDQSTSRKIYFQAGGFFKLNWGILGSITSTIATYSIVIIQFLLK